MNDPIISVIVPVYKVEQWLPACVDSLLAQEFLNFELLLVDDGSPDGCPELCEAYAQKDERVRVIHRQNGGLSAARNTGIAAARGKYLAFVDSDDVVAPDYLSKMLEAAQGSDADMVVAGFCEMQQDGTIAENAGRYLAEQPGTFGGRELLAQFFGPGAIYYTVAWNKLYRAALWQSLRYPEGILHEDDAVAHHIYAACQTVCCLNETLYFYRQREGSICRSGVRPGSFDGITAHLDWCRFFAADPELAPLLPKALEGCWHRYLGLCFEAKQGPVSWELYSRWQCIQTELRELLPLLKLCRSLKMRDKLSCLLWAYKKLPTPPKTDKKRVVLLLPPTLPVPAVQGGAVETLAQHLIEQNEQEQKLELCVVARYDPEAAEVSSRFKHTVFHYQKEPGRSLWHSVHFRLSALLGKPIHWNRWFAQPVNFLKDIDADAYIAEGGDASGWQQASRELGRERFWVHLHGEAVGSPELDQIYSGAIAISDYIRGAWQNGTDRFTEIVPNCVDDRAFCPATETDRVRAMQLREELGYTPDDFVVLFCGRTCPEKGIHQLIRALRKLPDPAMKLLVVGSPFFGVETNSAYFAELKEQAKSLGDRIQFTGFVHNSKLPDYYRMADVACFPALWNEPAGITAIEAMACGCPIIATRSGGMPEYLAGSNAVLVERSEAFKDGKLVPVKSIFPMDAAIAMTLKTLKAAPERRKAMSEAGLTAAKRYTAAEYYRRILAALSSKQS